MQETRMVLHSIRERLQVCGLKASTLYLPVDITYQSSPCKPAGMHHGCAESSHLETCLQVDNFVGSQPVGICRKENETISFDVVLLDNILCCLTYLQIWSSKQESRSQRQFGLVLYWKEQSGTIVLRRLSPQNSS